MCKVSASAALLIIALGKMENMEQTLFLRMGERENTSKNMASASVSVAKVMFEGHFLPLLLSG